jgi:predicted SprT family Zn-dependent metalloprotease
MKVTEFKYCEICGSMVIENRDLDPEKTRNNEDVLCADCEVELALYKENPSRSQLLELVNG